MGALAPAILKIGLLAPSIVGQSITVSTRNSKVINRPLDNNNFDSTYLSKYLHLDLHLD